MFLGRDSNSIYRIEHFYKKYIYERVGRKVLEWRSGTGRRSAEQPPTTWPGELAGQDGGSRMVTGDPGLRGVIVLPFKGDDFVLDGVGGRLAAAPVRAQPARLQTDLHVNAVLVPSDGQSRLSSPRRGKIRHIV
ncbi:hypothetical protein EVAR_17878_1 [Eumeta japonica]|uniref:Uncharacterized protein n=1 Tax=Eumeta variegata TaxID=151549 RepID=A0A4C1UYR6_EUMVA|nr:hypothetical protein EVAR_17878_1 [Eumeta japonica]